MSEGDEESGSREVEHAVPTWSPSDRAAVQQIAENAVDAYLDTGLNAAEWREGFNEYLTASAALNYAYVDPAAIPSVKRTGPGTITEDASAYVATVAVPTTEGDYELRMIRSDGSSPWRVARLDLPR